MGSFFKVIVFVLTFSCLSCGSGSKNKDSIPNDMIQAVNQNQDGEKGRATVPLGGVPLGQDGWPVFQEDQIAMTLRGISDFVFVERKGYSVELINNGLVGVKYRIALTGKLRRGSFGNCMGGGGLEMPGADGDPTKFFPLQARDRCFFTIRLPISIPSDLINNSIKVYIEGRNEPVINHRIVISSYNQL